MTARAIALALIVLTTACKRVSSPVPPTGQCKFDYECALPPSNLTCCLDCPPAPPFKALPAWFVDRMYIKNDERCSAKPDYCPEAGCAMLPARCTAHAACEKGACVAVTSPECEARL